MHYDILDEQRRRILPLLKEFKTRFYLAGDTALAFYFGHRDSIDFDFFTEEEIDTQKFFETLREIFTDHSLTKIQEEKNTLSVLVDKNIKISFFTYHYPLLKSPIEEDYFRVASIEDIACMKLSAITGRASNKDYIDLYYILQTISLETLLEMTRQKFISLDTNLVLKSLVYFKDVSHDPILFKEGKEVSFDGISAFLEKEVKRLTK